METKLLHESPASVETDWLIACHFENLRPDRSLQALDEALSGLISALRESGDLTGKSCEVVLNPHAPGIAARRLCIVGLGPDAKLDRAALHRAVSAAAMAVSKKDDTSVAILLPDVGSRLPAGVVAETAATALTVGCFGPGLYRAEPQRYPFRSISIVAAEGEQTQQLQQIVERGQTIGEAVNLARELVNRPAADIYPESFAARAQQIATEVGLKCEILEESKLETERMNALLAVARGSDRPPRVVVLRHDGGGEEMPTIALVGKGVTFDSGGLSIKPTEGMKTMKCDMAGAATVLATMSAIARLKLPVNVVGLMGLVENMVSGKSYKLGDVLTARNGTTIEVLNTDAEGRLVLADVLAYAVDLGVERMIDLATLTGACVVALGEDFVGAFTNNEEWCGRTLAAARSAGELMWQMPMDDSFCEQLVSDVADCKNVGKRWGGAITAAKFLEKFVGKTPWIHLDIAGPAFAECANGWRESGATGVMVRTLVELLAADGQAE